MMPEDLKELLRAFNDHAVKYLIVGGYAFGGQAKCRLLALLLARADTNSTRNWNDFEPALSLAE